MCAHNSEVLETFCGKLKEHLSDEFYKFVGRNVQALALALAVALALPVALSEMGSDSRSLQLAVRAKKMSWKTVWKLKVIKGNIPKIKTIKL